MGMGKPPENGDGERHGEPKGHMKKREGKWVTWLEVDGKKVPGSEKIHDNIQDARNWIKGPTLN